MITFLQHNSTQYPPRTYENASADATIAFAFNFNTPGELLTKDSVKAQSKLYLPINVKTPYDMVRIKSVSLQISDRKATTLNIAGNQLATAIKYGYTQDSVDESVYRYLYAILHHPGFDANITLIRSGGQSGFDEAGLKAAVRLGIPAICLCPRGWKFADINGKTICDERQFKNRFNSVLNL